MKIRNKIFIIFNLFYVYKETKHFLFYKVALCIQKHETNFYNISNVFYTYEKTKQQKTTPLYLLSVGNTPNVFCTFIKNSYTYKMKKKQGKALVSSIEIPEALADFNESNNVTRARLVFTFNSTVESDGDDITSMLAARSGNQTYSVIIDITDMGNNSVECLKNAKATFEGKQATFTVFNWDVSELNDNGETVVNNGSREYSSLSDPYIGDNTDEESSLTRMRSRLNSDVENGNLEFGTISQVATNQQRPTEQNFRRMR